MAQRFVSHSSTASLEVSSAANVGTVPEVSPPRTAVCSDTCEGTLSFGTGRQQAQSDYDDHTLTTAP